MILSLLCISAFFAGFVDSIVGGGGLIQLPALMALMPQTALPLLFGTNKFSSIFGTSLAIFRYSRKKISIPLRIILPSALIALLTSWWGAHLISHLSNHSIKPAIIVILVAVTVFTFLNKNFGAKNKHLRLRPMMVMKTLVGAAIIGFYDGFLGPGTGGFLIFLFIGTLGLDFLSASVSAKWVNWATNIAAVVYFAMTDQILYRVAMPMAICNMAGSYLGTHLAVRKGIPFVRILFMVVISLIFLKLSYDIL